MPFPENSQSIIGSYGSWAASLRPNPPALSLRATPKKKLGTWKKEALAKVKELVASPAIPQAPTVTVEKKYTYDGLDIEELSWQLPYGRPTKALLLKPAGTTRRLPGILALHDHSGEKYYGYGKITRTSNEQDPHLREHQAGYYEGTAWANEVAKRGYVVLVPDAFLFGSRRVHYEDVDGISWGMPKVEAKTDADITTPEEVAAYNAWSSAHEHVMSKSLFCAGTTWPGVVLAEDQMALTLLSQRPDVDASRMGCAGLSGGGLRTVYLAGLDERIKCAVSVGFMSTWNDFMLHKAYTHTWMVYAPLLPNYLEFPEILGLRVPLPVMVQSNNDDRLYTLPEMQKADAILQEVYRLAGTPDAYQGRFYDGDHKFDRTMQADAFGWFDKWLGGGR
jgi:dienelactone hydrolase